MRYYPNLTDEKELGRITFKHYLRLMKAARLREFDEELNMHLSAWKRREIQMTDKKSQYIYKNFKDFFDADKRKNELLGVQVKKPKISRIQQTLLLKANMKEGG